MIVKMAKIRILGPKPLLPVVIEILQAMGAIHIESKVPDLDQAAEIPRPRRFALEEATLQIRQTLEVLLDQVEKILLLLPRIPEAPSPGFIHPDEWGGALENLHRYLEPIAERCETISKKRRHYEDELSLLSRYDKVIRAVLPLFPTVEESRDFDYMGVTFRTEDQHVIPALEQAIDRLTGGHYELLLKDVDKDTLAGILVFPKEKVVELRSLLWEENVGELRLPISIGDKSLPEALRIIPRKQIEIPQRIKKLDQELIELSRRWSAKLNHLHRWLANKHEHIIVSASFYETKMTFIIYGWIPEKELPHLQEHLDVSFEKRVVAEQLPVEQSEKDQVPVALRNHPLVRPFEIFTRILPLPRYGTIDPTPFMALFFPLFFGIIIGDIGYGLVLFVTAMLVWRRYSSQSFIKNLAVILLWSSLSTIIWGVAYGELFGDLGEQIGLHPVFMSRMESFLDMLFFGLAVGATHIMLGIGLGFYIAFHQGKRQELIAKLSGLVLVVAFIIMISGIIGWLPSSTIPMGLFVVLLSLVVLIIGGGPSAIMELHNLVNILSYLRLVGIGIASVALAFAANKLGSLVDNIVLGIMIGMLLHSVNLVFAIISPTVQSLRLHYVEFFENFFVGGGREYRPFRKQI
jgi:V/A-type H+/Na+-transporting ATPase subunit I